MRKRRWRGGNRREGSPSSSPTPLFTSLSSSPSSSTPCPLFLLIPSSFPPCPLLLFSSLLCPHPLILPHHLSLPPPPSLPPPGTIHPGVQCIWCEETPITGIVWKCAFCYGYSLCTCCYMADKHSADHPFDRCLTKDHKKRCGMDVTWAYTCMDVI